MELLGVHWGSLWHFVGFGEYLLKFPNAVVLNAVGRRRAQKSANKRKRARTPVRKRAPSKRAQKGAKRRKNYKQPGLKQELPISGIANLGWFGPIRGVKRLLDRATAKKIQRHKPKILNLQSSAWKRLVLMVCSHMGFSPRF